jgi:signal transduction histidine kinase
VTLAHDRNGLFVGQSEMLQTLGTPLKAWLNVPTASSLELASAQSDTRVGVARSFPTADAFEHASRRLKYVQLLNRMWVVFGLVALLTIPLYSYWQISLVVVAGTAVTFVVVQSLLYGGRIRAACLIFCIATDLVFVSIFLVFVTLVDAVEAFRTQAPVLMLMGVTTIFASALIAPRAGFLFAAINTAIVIGLRLALAPDVEPRPSVVVFGWLLAMVAFLYERSLRGVFAQLRDIRLGLESTVHERTRELHNSVTSLETLTEQLKTANNDLELFSASVAHDLRAPLRIIEGYSRLLQDDLSGRSPSAEQAVQRMLQVEHRMNRLIEGLLTFARLGHHAVRTEQIDMQDLARRIVAELSEAEHGRSLQIQVSELPPCTADSVLIEQVFVNLLSNAIKFTRPRATARIDIRGEIVASEVIYSIRDNGVGFAMEQGGRLFNTLQRLHSQDEFEGSGIGLAMVKRIVQRHGGRVWAESRVNGGAEFSFAIPLPAAKS